MAWRNQRAERRQQLAFIETVEFIGLVELIAPLKSASPDVCEILNGVKVGWLDQVEW